MHSVDTRKIGNMVEAIDELLPEDYDIEQQDDGEIVVISKPTNDDVLGELRFTNERERGEPGGPDYVLNTYFSGNRDEEKTLWFSANQALQHLVNMCG